MTIKLLKDRIRNTLLFESACFHVDLLRSMWNSATLLGYLFIIMLLPLMLCSFLALPIAVVFGRIVMYVGARMEKMLFKI